MIEIANVLDAVRYLEGIKAVIFDLDDTLYGEKEYIRSGYRKIAKRFPWIAGAETKMWHLFASGEPAIDDFLKQEGLYSEQLKQECLKIYRTQEPEIHLYAGVREMFINLHQSGYKTGIITDGRPEGQRAKIKALNLEEAVDQIIVTDELGGAGMRKPNPESFCLMAESMMMKYEEMCYVGDNIRKDFIAPEKLGIRSIWFRNEEGLYC